MITAHINNLSNKQKEEVLSMVYDQANGIYSNGFKTVNSDVMRAERTADGVTIHSNYFHTLGGLRDYVPADLFDQMTEEGK